MRARPDEVRLILVDLKRVELAPYDGLPHLLQHVIVEAARGARPRSTGRSTRWRSATSRWRARGPCATSPPTTPARRGPRTSACRTSCSIIDELADLIMREGRKVEDPIVKIAQKARAVGHPPRARHAAPERQRRDRPHQGQRAQPRSPSRWPRTSTAGRSSTQPGAEDLIGRGDMLYQPADLPRPVRLQGVFVSDAEVNAVTDHWRRQADAEPYYDDVARSRSATARRTASGGQFGWLAKMAEDEHDAARRRAGDARPARRARRCSRPSSRSASTGPAGSWTSSSATASSARRTRATRPSPRIVYGPDNWLRSHDDVDDPGD